jgi:formylglycine-generating enzyme required for sulfatase activity
MESHTMRHVWRSALGDVVEVTRLGESTRLRGALRKLQSDVAGAATSDIEELAGLSAVHASPWVRQAVLQGLAVRAPSHPAVRDAIAWLSHDYEDFVAFEAIDLAGRLGIRTVLADLLLIVGRASRRMDGAAGKPVGIGHALVLRAVAALAGSDRPRDLAAIEDDLFGPGTDEATYPAVPPCDAAGAGSHTHAGMVRVPGGTVRGGPPPSFDHDGLRFDWNDPALIGSCDDFSIDVLPVGNAEYDAFAQSDAAQRHLYCHPAEPKDKLHLRNTLLDRRSGPDHPVTGVDWFDAYAYTRSQGKRLPTEAEWQRAAEGDDRRAYPWGDEFDPDRTHCRPDPPSPGWEGILAWRRDLLAVLEDPPKLTTRPRGIPGSASPWGARDMAGNVWEWTASSFAGPPLSPVGADRDAVDVIYDQRSYAVIKGGTWTSLPEQVSVAFRGRDLALDRHFEIGFRGACRCARDDQEG